MAILLFPTISLEGTRTLNLARETPLRGKMSFQLLDNVLCPWHLEPPQPPLRTLWAVRADKRGSMRVRDEAETLGWLTRCCPISAFHVLRLGRFQWFLVLCSWQEPHCCALFHIIYSFFFMMSLSVCSTNSPRSSPKAIPHRPLLFKVRSPGQQQHRPAACQKSKLPGLAADSVDQNLHFNKIPRRCVSSWKLKDYGMMPHIDCLFLLYLIFLIINAITVNMQGSQRGAKAGRPRVRGLYLARLESLLRREECKSILS